MLFPVSGNKSIIGAVKDLSCFVNITHQENALQDPATVIESSVAALDFADDVRDAALHYLEMARTESA